MHKTSLDNTHTHMPTHTHAHGDDLNLNTAPFYLCDRRLDELNLANNDLSSLPPTLGLLGPTLKSLLLEVGAWVAAHVHLRAWVCGYMGWRGAEHT